MPTRSLLCRNVLTTCGPLIATGEKNHVQKPRGDDKYDAYIAIGAVLGG